MPSPIDTRRLILRLSLGCLAVTAASAVLMMVLPFGGFVGRFTLTGLAATVTSACAIPFGAWALQPQTRWAGLVGIAFLCAELLLLMAALWVPILTPWSIDMELFSAMVYILAVAPFAMCGACAVDRRPWAGWPAIAGALLGLLPLLYQAFADGGLDRLDTTGAVSAPLGFTLVVLGGGLGLGLIASTVPRSGPAIVRRWPLIAALLTTVAAALSIWFFTMEATIGRGSVPPGVLTTALTLSLLGYGTGLANVLLLPALRGFGPLVQALTALAAIATAATLSLWIATDDDWWAPLFFGSLIILLSGSAGIAILRKFFAEEAIVAASDLIKSLDLTCPRCHRRQQMALGESACDHCGLRFSIRVEAPRCRACGHALIGSASERCPECGVALELGPTS